MASCALQARSTVLITGGSGSLGSAIALDLTRAEPDRYHLILTCRNLNSPHVTKLSSELKSLEGSFEFQILDLTSLPSISAFSNSLRDRILNDDIPKFSGGGLIHSAAFFGWTATAWNKMYKTNVLGPMLLIRRLEGALQGALVVGLASAVHSIGSLDVLAYPDEEDIQLPGSSPDSARKVGLQEGLKRYGSSKLLFLMSLYAFQRRLERVSVVTVFVAFLPISFPLLS